MVAINEFLKNNFMTDSTQLRRIIEAALLAAAQPLTLPQLSAIFGENEAPTHEEIARAIEELTQDCAERGVELVEVASGFRYQIKQDVHPWVARLWTERQTKYSRALLETLALIAYRQPITRGEIEGIRGVAVSSNMVKTLEEREWIRVVGYRDVPGKPALFGTTRLFLDYFNLKSLDELPPLAEIKDIEEFDPQLTLGPVAPPPDDNDSREDDIVEEIPHDAEAENDDVTAANDASSESAEEHSA
jgi:segregation and condensation protein B